MSIRFYSSDVDPAQTASEIQQILSVSKARRVTTLYDEKSRVEAIQFVLQINGQPMGFRLSPDTAGMEKALNEDEDTPGSFGLEQARRTAWRVNKEWLNTLLAFNATNQASLDKLLLGFGVTPDGSTVYQRIRADRQLLDAPK